VRKAAPDLPRKLLNSSRKYRLTHKREFDSVFAKPYKTTRHFLIALYIPNQFTHPRLGIITGKRHINTAVARNRCRRIIRESFRQYRDQLGAWDIIVMIRSASPVLKKADGKQTLRTEIDALWQPIIAKNQ
jgi:ribonuclease P protein component